jgi:protein SCO1/2
MVLLLTAVGCGTTSETTSGTGDAPPGSTAADEIEGLRRDPPLDVTGVTLPEVSPDQPEQPFELVPQPGNLLFVYFGYTHCPDLCPTTMADLRKGLKQLGPDAERVEVAFVTVDPERDTADVLPAYLDSFVDGAHALRTDDPAALQAAEDAFLASSTITPLDDGTYSVSHTAFSSIVDEHGVVVAEWPFGFSADSMARDLRILLAEVPTPAGATTTTAGPTS